MSTTEGVVFSSTHSSASFSKPQTSSPQPGCALQFLRGKMVVTLTTLLGTPKGRNSESVDRMKITSILNSNLIDSIRPAYTAMPLDVHMPFDTGVPFDVALRFGPGSPPEGGSPSDVGSPWQTICLSQEGSPLATRWPSPERSMSDPGSPLPSADNTSPNASNSQPRQKYKEEQLFFIWYHRIDLDLSWNQVRRMYVRHWHEKRPKSGLQCKFYRILEQYNVEKVRGQSRKDPKARGARVPNGRNYGVVATTGRVYDWMQPRHKLQALKAKL